MINAHSVEGMKMPPDMIMPFELQLRTLQDWLRRGGIDPDTVDLHSLIDRTLHLPENMKNIARILGLPLTPIGEISRKEMRGLEEKYRLQAEELEREKRGIEPEKLLCPRHEYASLTRLETWTYTRPDGTLEMVIIPPELLYYRCPITKHFYRQHDTKMYFIHEKEITEQVLTALGKPLPLPAPPTPKAPPPEVAPPPPAISLAQAVEDIVSRARAIEELDRDFFETAIQKGKTLREIVEMWERLR